MKDKGETPVMFSFSCCSHLGPPRRGTSAEEQRDSAYYHPTLNPTGAPPPGKPPMYLSSVGLLLLLPFNCKSCCSFICLEVGSFHNTTRIAFRCAHNYRYSVMRLLTFSNSPQAACADNLTLLTFHSCMLNKVYGSIQICVVALLTTIWVLVGGLFYRDQDFNQTSWTWTVLWDWMVAFPWVPALYTGIFSTGICLWIEISAKRDVSATETAVIYGLEPLGSAGFVWFLLSKRWGNSRMDWHCSCSRWELVGANIWILLCRQIYRG